MPETVIPFQPKDENGNLLSMKTRTNTIYKPNGDPLGDDFLGTADIANNVTTTTAGKVLDARQGKALQDQVTSLNSTLDDLVITRSYSFKYNIEPNEDLNISANDLQIIRPSGYIPLSLYEITSGYTNVLIRSIILSSTGTDTVVTLRNISNVFVAGATMYLTMKYIKSSVQG